MNECYVCGNDLEMIKDEPHEYEEEGLNIVIHGLVQYRCGQCGEKFTPIPTPLKLHKYIGQVICQENKGLLLANEIRFLRKTMGLKAKELADIMGADASTVSRWENGVKMIGESNDRLLRTIFLLFSKQQQDANDLDMLMELPRSRKEVKQPKVMSINPPDWLLSDRVPA